MTSSPADARLLTARSGPSATRALRHHLDQLQGLDRLTPVDVVVPSAVAGMTVRRQLVDPGLANVRFSSLPQFAERLALRHLALIGRRPLTHAARTSALRTAIADVDNGVARAAGHPQTESMLEQLFTELDDAEAQSRGALPRLLSRGATARAVAELYECYRVHVGDALDGAAVTRAAAAAVRLGAAPVTDLVVFAPRRLLTAEEELLAALHDQSRLRGVVCEPADPSVSQLLEGLLGPPRPVDAGPAAEPSFVVAPDAEEEVRIAVRQILSRLGSSPVRPEQIAVGYRSAVPYTRLLAEQLTAAGVPHHVPAGRHLSETVAGRFLLGLLGLELSDYARADLISWLSDGPVRTPAGPPVPSGRWDRLSRDAGVSRGLDVWRDRLTTARDGIQRRRAATDDVARQDAYARRVADHDGLLEFVECVAAHVQAVVGATTWVQARDALRSALHDLLGGAASVERWGGGTEAQRDAGVEQAAYSAVVAAVSALADLDATGPPPAPDAVRRALRQAFDRPASNRTTLGRGVVIAPLRDLVGADLELLAVVGMTEEAMPARVREHPLLRDDDRGAAACGLLRVADRRAQDLRDFQSALHTAREVVLSFPRADSRAQRRQHPSPWFTAALQSVVGDSPIRSGDVVDRPEQLPVLAPASFVAALAGSGTVVPPAEHDVRVAMSGAADEIADARYQRGRTAVRARRDGVFGPWTGHVGPLPEPLASKAEAALSASSLQEWSTCPHTFWLHRVLGVRDLETTEDEVMDPLRRGSLVHEVLERFFTDHIGTLTQPGRAPDLAWSPADVERAREMLDAEAALLEAQGRTGRPLLWKAERARLHRSLARILSVDSRLRARRRSWPIAVELPFGRDGAPALVLDLPVSGSVAFAGSVDRVDATEGGELIVVDYKTGKGKGYEAIPLLDKPHEAADLVDRGRKLQLVLYALAAQRDYGPPVRPASAYYWFVELGAVHRGAPIGSHEEARLHEVLDVAVRGIREGIYPAHPGELDGWYGWESCSWCPYDRACASTRGEVWLSISTADPVQAYRELTAGLTQVSA